MPGTHSPFRVARNCANNSGVTGPQYATCLDISISGKALGKFVQGGHLPASVREFKCGAKTSDQQQPSP